MAFDQYYNQYGSEFGVSPEVLGNIAQLESSGNPNAVNNWDSNAQAGIPSQGLMQYIQPTFNTDYAAAAAARPQMFAEMGERDWMNPQQQIASAAYAISQGKGDQWATYGKAQGGNVPKSNAPTGEVEYGGTTAEYKSPAPYRAGLTGEDQPFVMQKGMSPKMAQIAIAFSSSPELASAYMQKQAQREAPAPSSGGQGQDGQMNFDSPAFPRKEGEPMWQWLQRQGAERFGLQNDPGIGQTYGGQHSKGSAHYGGTAIDFGDAKNTIDQLNQANDYYQSIGAKTIWQAPGHYNHLHVEYQ